MSTTDYEEWLSLAEPDETEEIYGLYEAVSLEETNGIWNVIRNGKKLVISVGHVKQSLIIASDTAKLSFLSILKEKYMDDANDVESWYGFQRNMDNPKA
ncbi:hypothetical protein [Pectobacterium fontis]|uniref:Uncharacterized protein n=1 Tax=Pectobacterium fontis TaxID=2558042 RepID=A0A7V8L3D4_9GAMM|nr:hypothetical protein [Pectobacterium fontis]KHN49234.1 hypothetical protein OI69_18510 [Pectobacterium fontis]